ncbi:thioredoxin family protein [Siminovitchia acidinfaciens]|uniref:Thioredoxin family protein n=1 Tax=Siminovitchia acidinfaciens TaxID=2321395 RepID=A0A429XWG8_9BACI|nr:thioredoxin family protein [Siminovitchia acidinfaciens]RST72729.1 thioredoxin family protein [Siminovitchia acidinfaciens]
MNLNEWFDKGLTTEQYIEDLEYHKDSFLHIYENFQPPADEGFFNKIKGKNLRVVALAEVWCGHCMLNVPVLLRLAEKTEMDVRLLPRDQHLDLMDQYLTNGNRVIPIFIFIDENGEQVAKWGPITESTKAFVGEFKKDLPSKDDDSYEEKFKSMIKIVAKTFKENSDFWNDSYESMKETLAEVK